MKNLDLDGNKGKKGKAIPLQAWTGPEGSRILRLPDFKTSRVYNLSNNLPGELL